MFENPLSGRYREVPGYGPHGLLVRMPFFQTSLQVLAYAGALAAIANNIRNSVYTDLRTVSGWRCAALFMPLVWSLLAVVVHAWGMIAVRVRLQYGYRPSIRSAIRSTTFQRVRTGEDGVLSEVLFWLASLCAILHMIFGILVLSSLVFISALEALQVFAMYVASVFLCQFILLLELANMRYELSKELDAGPTSSGITQISKVDLSRAWTTWPHLSLQNLRKRTATVSYECLHLPDGEKACL